MAGSKRGDTDILSDLPGAAAADGDLLDDVVGLDIFGDAGDGEIETGGIPEDVDPFADDDAPGESDGDDAGGDGRGPWSSDAGGWSAFGDGEADALSLILDATDFRDLRDSFTDSWDWTPDPGTPEALDGPGFGDDATPGSSASEVGHGGDKLHGDGGDDLLVGGSGPDIGHGGKGDDVLFGTGGDDKLFGGHGDDVLDGGSGSDKVDGGHGDDVLSGGDGDDRVRGGHGDDLVSGGDGSDKVDGGKGDDVLDGGGGDDWLLGHHGDDVLDGGTGSDVVDGGKGDDLLVFTVAENAGQADYYDGGKGVDTLQLNLTASEFTDLQAELIELRDWIAETANSKRSESHRFNDESVSSAKHPIFETSFGLSVRNFEELKVNVEGYGEVSLDEGLPELDTPDPDPDSVDIDLDTTPSSTPSTVDEVASTDGPISLKSADVVLREGSTATISVEVEVRELPPKFDVYMLQDLSGSFYDDLPNVRAEFSGLYDTLTADSDVQFGVGSFIDKPVIPFGWYTDYVYETNLAITGDKAAVQDTLDGLYTQSGYDWQEAQLEGLVQVALRGDEIGFRDGAQKFVVLSTDAAFHQEGDYAEAGPNDYDTEIEDEDYPSIAKVGELLKAAGITPVFAVTEYVVGYYQSLVDIWGFGSVTVLSADSSNLAAAITGGLKAASTDLILSVSGDDFGYVSSITPDSYEDVGAGFYTFDIVLDIPEDSIDYSSDSLTLVIDGYGEVNVEVKIAQVDATGDVGDDTLSGSDGPNALYGMAGNDTLDGGGGEDTLVGGTGDDILTGGLGDDMFVFADGDGNDTITDFVAGAGSDDVIDLRLVSGIGGFTDVMAAAVQVGGDAVIDLGDANSVTLLGVDTTQLAEQDFLF